MTKVKMAIPVFRGLPSLMTLLTLILQLCSCRRTMVNNLWCRKLVRAWHQTKSDPPHARVFSEPRCRNYVTMWYLIYRWIISICWLGIILCSIEEFGSANPIGNNKVWPIYLTNWDLVLGAVQSVIGAFLVSKRWLLQNTANDLNGCDSKCGKLEKIYWILYTVTCTLAVGVTVSYWTAVYDSRIHHLDALNIMLHVCNSVLMLADVCITNIPLKFRYFWWCLILIIFYLIFSIIYFAAGGLDKNGYHYIYKILDWKKPGITLIIALGGIIFLVIVHCLLCFIANILDKRLNSTMTYVVEPTLSSNEHKKESKNLEIV